MSQAAGGSPGRALSPRQAPPAPRLCTRAVGAAQTRSWVWFWGRRRRKLVLPLLVAARRFRTVLAPLGPPLCPFLLLVPWETPAPPQRNARSHIINSVLFVFLSFFFSFFFLFSKYRTKILTVTNTGFTLVNINRKSKEKLLLVTNS